MTVLERAGEERARRGKRLERRAVRPEADDDEPRIDSMHRLEQHLHALLLDQLPEVDDERPGPVEERGQPLRVAVVGQALVAAVRWILARLGEQVRERCVTVLQHEPVDVDARRHLDTRSRVPTTSSSTSRMCSEPT